MKRIPSHGIGGYNVLTGRDWRWEIPADLQLRVPTNILEFIGCYVNMKLAVAEGDIEPADIAPLETNPTSAEGWITGEMAVRVRGPVRVRDQETATATTTTDTVGCVTTPSRRRDSEPV